MDLNKTYDITPNGAIHALEELADKFLSREYQENITFRGRVLDDFFPETGIEQWPSKYWYGGEQESMIETALQTVTQSSNASICEKMLSIAYRIAREGMYYSNESTPRFDIRHLVDVHRSSLNIDYDKGIEKTFDVKVGDGWWHLGLSYVRDDAYNQSGRMKVHFANNWDDELTDGFERLYSLLFGEIIEKYTLKKE